MYVNTTDEPAAPVNGENGERKPWKIYPPPPKPHWESRDPFEQAAPSAEPGKQYEFQMEECEIPGEHPYVFELDSQGVYQVYTSPEVGACHFRYVLC